MMPIHYTHISGLHFTTERLMSFNERDSHDINVICLWLPNSTQTPMKLIDWYCGDLSYYETMKLADKYVDTLTFEEIMILIDLQDRAEAPEAEYIAARNCLRTIREHLQTIEQHRDDIDALDDVVKAQYAIVDLMQDNIEALLTFTE